MSRWTDVRSYVGAMNKLRAFVFGLCALLAVAPAADAARGKKKLPPKYFFIAHETITSVTTSDCKSIGNDNLRTKETTTFVIFSERRGHLGGNTTSTGYTQTTLERTGNDPYLPPAKSETPKHATKFKDSTSRFWRKGSRTATFRYGIVGNEYSERLTLPKVNRELTRSFDRTYRDESTSDSRCSYTDKVTIKGGVTLQRVQ